MFDLPSCLLLAFLLICCVLQEADPTGCILQALVSAGFGEWEAVWGVGGMLEGHGREKSGIFPLCFEQYLKVAMAETSPGSRFWTGHCGSSFCQVTTVYVFLEHCVLPLSLVTESHQAFPIEGHTVNI